MMKRTRALIPVALVLVSMTAYAWQGQATMPDHTTPSATSSTTPPTFSQRSPRYRLQASDVFDLSFEYTPEFNQTVTVQPDGFITLRSVGDVSITGLTVQEATEKISQAYSKILAKPVVSLLLKDFQKPYFIADGQVRQPGKYELRGDVTVVQAVAMAGGFNSQFARHSQVVLFRRVDNNWAEATVLDVKKMQKSRDLSEDVRLRPGDMIFVPKNTWSKIQQWMPIYSVNAMGAQTKAF